jgi:hypothetical protein
MTAVDERLVTLRLARNWVGKVERDEMELHNAWDLLIERIGAMAQKFQACVTCGMTPCGDPGYCSAMRAADEKIAASRRCAQCNAAGGDLDPHQDRERKRIIYLHRGACERFWKARHR